MRDLDQKPKTTKIPDGHSVAAPSVINIGPAFVVQPDIDLLSPTLDSRITYVGGAHMYWAQNGLLATTVDNQWPLEYRNGVAVGRGEPEPTVNTWQIWNRGNNTAGAPTNNVENPAGTMVNAVGLGPDGGDIASLPLTADSYCVSQDTGSIDHIPVTPYVSQLTNQWQRFVFPVTQTVNSRMRTWIGRSQANGTPNEYLTQTGALTARQWVFSFFAKLHPSDATRFLAGCVMLERENYPYATAPIFTAGTIPLTRYGAGVLVAYKQGYRGIRVYFTDNTTTDYTFPDTTGVNLATSQKNWGERYITKIEYRR